MSVFLEKYNGSLTGLMRWPQFDTLTSVLNSNNDGGWYVYYVGEEVPSTSITEKQFKTFIDEITQLLRSDHREDYLGIVYVDDLENPSFVKIYDPNNLGSACGSSGMRALPGWTLSRSEPVDLQAEFPNPGGRRRWWQSLFA